MSTRLVERPAVWTAGIGETVGTAFRSAMRAVAVRRAERREVRSWLGRNHPSIGRDTGCRV